MLFKLQTITAVVIRRGEASQILAINTLQNNQQIAGIPLSIKLQAYIEKEPIARGSWAGILSYFYLLNFGLIGFYLHQLFDFYLFCWLDLIYVPRKL